MTCKKCGCKDINDCVIEAEIVAYCPICGDDLKEQKKLTEEF